jgi:hypothetical protein
MWKVNLVFLLFVVGRIFQNTTVRIFWRKQEFGIRFKCLRLSCLVAACCKLIGNEFWVEWKSGDVFLKWWPSAAFQDELCFVQVVLDVSKQQKCVWYIECYLPVGLIFIYELPMIVWGCDGGECWNVTPCSLLDMCRRFGVNAREDGDNSSSETEGGGYLTNY